MRFHFRPIPFVATVLLVALGIALGRWQDGRAEGKIAAQHLLAQRSAEPPLRIGAAALAPAEVELAPVAVRGSFVADWPVFLDNRPQNGKTGFVLVMPFRIEGTDTHVLVARGWLPRYTGEYGRLPPFGTPAGSITVQGLAKASLGRVQQLGEAAPLAPRAILQNLDVAQFAKASGLQVQPFFIEQHGPVQPDEQLLRDWPAPSLGVEKHQGYAFQWYALALMAFLFFVITGFRRGTKHNN